MRFVGIALVVLTACSRIAGIGDEFQVRDGDGGSDGPTVDVIVHDAPPAGVFAQRAYIKASNPGLGDAFGFSLALSGDGTTLAVGASLEDSSARDPNGPQSDEQGTDSGAVYVFVQSAGVWTQQAYLKSSNSDDDDRFGYAVALSDDGNTLLVGAALEDSDGTSSNNNTAGNAGAAYVFVRSGASWSQQRYLKASNTGSGDEFGWLVALSGDGNTAVITAIYEDSPATLINGSQTTNTASASGAAYVYVRTGTTWTQQAYVKASNTAADSFFGRGLSLSRDGNTLVVGAAHEDSGSMGINQNETNVTAPNAGAAYVYVRNGTTWTKQAYLKASNAGMDDNFGWCSGLSADGNVLVIGAPNEDGGATGFNGNQGDDPTKANSGAAYLFVRSGVTWTQEAYVKATNTGASDQFAVRAAMSPDGNAFTVGTIHEDGGAGLDGNQQDESRLSSGAAYMYSRAGSLSLVHYLKANNASADDHFGYLGPGTLQVVGAPDEDSAAAGINGDQANNSAPDSGAVYVFSE